jgi:hypothetical protein
MSREVVTGGAGVATRVGTGVAGTVIVVGADLGAGKAGGGNGLEVARVLLAGAELLFVPAVVVAVGAVDGSVATRWPLLPDAIFGGAGKRLRRVRT